MTDIEKFIITNEQDAMLLVQEKQRRLDFEYAWAGRLNGGNTYSCGVAQVYFNGSIYLGTPRSHISIKETIEGSNPDAS